MVAVRLSRAHVYMARSVHVAKSSIQRRIFYVRANLLMSLKTRNAKSLFFRVSANFKHKNDNNMLCNWSNKRICVDCTSSTKNSMCAANKFQIYEQVHTDLIQEQFTLNKKPSPE